MLNKEQAFIIHEFINKYATQNVWNVSDKMFDMVKEIVQANAVESQESLEEKAEISAAK